MAQAVERLLNLALYLADAPGTVTADQIRDEVSGYGPGQDDAAFKRMLERDKDDLRSAGLVIDCDDEGRYRLDRAATYVRSIDLTPEETAAIRAAGTALLGDASFPFPDDLRLALAKIAAEVEVEQLPAAARLADEDPARQGHLVAELSSAATRKKRVSFDYTNSAGSSAPHDVEPYGLFLHDGRWYLVGRDVAKKQTRTYTVGRMGSLSVNAAAPKTADFVRPAGFDVATFVRLPFQYGQEADEFTAVIRFDVAAAWRARRVTAGQGELELAGDGVVWRVPARSQRRLLRFVIENGPGIQVVGPSELVQALRSGLEETGALHA